MGKLENVTLMPSTLVQIFGEISNGNMKIPIKLFLFVKM